MDGWLYGLLELFQNEKLPYTTIVAHAAIQIYHVHNSRKPNMPQAEMDLVLNGPASFQNFCFSRPATCRIWLYTLPGGAPIIKEQTASRAILMLLKDCKSC